MKKKLGLLLILVVLFAVFVLVKFFIFGSSSDYGKLQVLSSPETNVFLNNVLIGKTPINDFQYKTGDALIKMIPAGNATDTASWNGKISIFKNSLTYVNRELGSSDINSAGEIFTTQKMSSPPSNSNNGEIYVDTNPQGAIVTLDNDEKGVAPLILQDVLRGDHELSVYMPGFFRRTQKINVDPGYRVDASFKLAIDQSQTSLQNLPNSNMATPSATPGANNVAYVTINNTPQGWLRVRADASIDATEEAKIKSGGKYPYVDQKNDWYEIKFNNDSAGLISGSFDTGWISAEYATKQ